MPVHRVQEATYQQLVDKLRLAVPKSLSMMAALDNTMKGRLEANFYVDRWPDFSALVCQYVWPRRSDAWDIGAYATSSDALLSVLTEGELITWDSRQELQRIEDKHADYLLSNLRPPERKYPALICIHERSVIVIGSCSLEISHFLVSQSDESERPSDMTAFTERVKKHLPEDIILGQLDQHHAELVTSHWPRLQGWPNKESCFRELLQRFYCPALFHIDNPDAPISYLIQFPSNQHFGHTEPQFQGRKILNFLSVLICAKMAYVEKFFPFEDETHHQGRIDLLTNTFGGTLTDHKVKDLVIDPHTTKSML